MVERESKGRMDKGKEDKGKKEEGKSELRGEGEMEGIERWKRGGGNWIGGMGKGEKERKSNVKEGSGLEWKRRMVRNRNG